MLIRRNSEHGARHRLQSQRLNIYKTLIERWIFDDSDEIEIRLLWYWTFLTFWNISRGFLTQTFNSWSLRGDFKSSVYKTNVDAILATSTKRYSWKSLKFNWEKIAKNSTLGGTMMKQFSCCLVFRCIT